jgi:lipid A ethanolaminephosphotransferase
MHNPELETTRPRLGLSATQLILAVSTFLLLTGNFTFFKQVLQVYPWNGSNAGFLLSVPVVLACEIVLLMALLSMVIPTRVTASVLLLVAAVTAYFADSFGTIVDQAMMLNVVQASPAETADLINARLLLRLALLAIVPIVLVWNLPLRPASYLRRLGSKLVLAFASVVVAALCVMVFSGQYASFAREHDAFRFYTNPAFPLYSAVKYLARSGVASTPAELVEIAPEATISAIDPHHKLTIMVVGETARQDRFSLNGYSRITNPMLAAEPRVFSYTHISSCGTSTAVSVPCMFALGGRENFDSDEANRTENVLDILQRVGVSILWRDNNTGSKGVADRVQFEDFRSADVNPVCDPECRDVGMLHGLQEFIDAQSGDILIVLHQMGNHGPAYYKRYPQDFERFTPACHSAEISECTDEEIGNAYDNAILYTDYFLSQVIALLKANTPKFQTAMLYISDHGESLGENGLYLHGMPYMLAPPEQTLVPVIVWVGDNSDIDVHSVLVNENLQNSQDAVFQSLLTIYEVETDLTEVPPGFFQGKEDN